MKAWPDTDVHAGLRAHRGVRRHHPPAARGAPRRTSTPSGCSRPAPCLPESRGAAWSTRESGEDVPTGQPGELWFRTPQLMKGYLGKPDGDRQGHRRRRVVPHRRHRPRRRRRLRLRLRPAQGHDHQRRGEHLLPRGRAGPLRAPRGRRGRGDRRPRRHAGARSSRRSSGLKPERLGDRAGDHRLHCQEHLAKFKCPRTVDVVEALPRNPTGKILKKDLRRRWEGHESQVV